MKLLRKLSLLLQLLLYLDLTIYFDEDQIFDQCTAFRKAYILSGSGFHKFLYSIIKSLKKNCEIAEFIPNQLRFHEKKL